MMTNKGIAVGPFVVTIVALLLLPHAIFAQEDSSVSRSIPRTSRSLPRSSSIQLAREPQLKDDSTRGETELRFSRTSRQLEPASARRLSALIAERRGARRPDSIVSHYHTILLLLENESDRRFRMDRMEAVANALNNAGVDLHKIRIGTVEDSANISYYKNCCTRHSKASKQSIQVLLIGDDTDSYFYRLHLLSAFLGDLSDFLPE